MYWDDTPSKIDSILQQEDVTLERILDEDDVLQECIANNEPLINFLTKEENIVRMLTIMTNEPPNSENEMETYKYPNIICEILTHDGNAFSNLISTNERYLSILWSFLDKSCLPPSNECSNQADDNVETPNEIDGESQAEEKLSKQTQPSITARDQLNPLLASFFTKVFLYLFTNDNEPVLKFLLSRQPPNDLVTVILKHISASAIMDFIFKTWEHVNVADKLNPEHKASPGFNNILIENGFVEQLIDVFKHPELESEQQNVANLISDIVRIKREILASSFGDQEAVLAKFDFDSEKTVRTLLDNMFVCRTKNSIVNGLKIIQALLQYNVHVQNMITQQEAQLSSMAAIQQKVDSPDENEEGSNVGLEPMPKFLKNNSPPSSTNEIKFMPPSQLMPPVGVQGEHLASCVRNVSKAIYERLDDFVDLLINTSNYTPIKTTVGVLEKPLGLIRLEVVHLFVALFATSDYNIMQKCSELNVLKILADLFFNYPLNNQLHKYFEQIVGYIFQNYHNFKTIHDKHQTNTNAGVGDDTQQETTDEIISHFIQLFEISNVLVQQILQKCCLIQKILENYVNEKVPVKSYLAKTIKEQQQYNKSDDNGDVVEMKESEERLKEEEAKTKEPVQEKPSKLVHIRPGYMGHLRLLANILKDRCNEQMMLENGLEELIPHWQELIKTKLDPINALIKSELVPESKHDINDAIRDEELKEAFIEYQNEVLSCPNLPDKVELIPEDIGQNPLETIKLKDNEIVFENFRDKRDENFSNFEKYFQMSTKIDEFEDDIDKPFGAGVSNESSKANSIQNVSPSQAVILQDFAMFDVKDSTLKSSLKNESCFDEFEDYFTNIDAFNAVNSDRIVNDSNPWGMDSSGDSSDPKPVVNDENWSFPADFVSNDPFVPCYPSNNQPMNNSDDELNRSNEEMFASNVTSSSSPVVPDGDRNDDSKEETEPVLTVVGEPRDPESSATDS